ncbi:MAG: DUF1573 domain-containing protein [Pirellulaceae bacterium]|nr:DUF1573 domain-containing protein [Pirellulaceae bacterium]
MSRRFPLPRIVLALLAGLLALTAGLKLHLLQTSPFADIVTATPLPILWLALFAEVIVIGVIITRVPSEIKWSVVTGFFAVLAVVSLYNVLSGKTSCGCAGAFEIHPAWFLAVNVVALALLMSIRPETNRVMQQWSEIRIPAQKAGTMAGIVLIAVGFSLSQSACARDYASAHWLGQPIVSVPANIGRLPSAPQDCELILRNVSNVECVIVGCQYSCKCIAPDDVVHAVIPPGGELPIRVQVKPTAAGRFHQRLLFFLDSPQQHVVAADIFGFFSEN